MPIPHQIQYIGKGQRPIVPPDPGFLSDLITYPYEEAVNFVATNSLDWQGQAQIFDLQDPSENMSEPYLWAQFYLLSPPQAGFEYRVALYKKVNDYNGQLVAISTLKNTEGNNAGFKWVKLEPPQGQSVINISSTEHYQIALLTNQYNVGEMVFACKAYNDNQPYKSNHITSPAAITSQTSEGDLMNIGFGGWRSDFYLWFGIGKSSAANSENLP